MIIYLDTSALVKLYVREVGSTDVQGWVRSADAIAISVVGYAEARATFGRVMQAGATSNTQHQRRVIQFNRDWTDMLRIELPPTLARNAGELAEIHGLRGFDAIHLASALWLRDKADEEFGFAAFDQRLCEEASRAGLQVLN